LPHLTGEAINSYTEKCTQVILPCKKLTEITIKLTKLHVQQLFMLFRINCTLINDDNKKPTRK